MAHDRTLDHYGTEDTTTTTLSATIGRYAAGTSLQDVLADMIGRVTRLETIDCFGNSFTANAVIARYLVANAVIKKTQSPGGLGFSLYADAYLANQFSFTADAVKQAVQHETFSYTADAVFIDDVECE